MRLSSLMKNLGNSEDRASGRGRGRGRGEGRGGGRQCEGGNKGVEGKGGEKGGGERPPSAGPVGPYLSLSLSLSLAPLHLLLLLAGAPISPLFKDEAFSAVVSHRQHSRSLLRRCYLFVISVFSSSLRSTSPAPFPRQRVGSLITFVSAGLKLGRRALTDKHKQTFHLTEALPPSVGTSRPVYL